MGHFDNFDQAFLDACDDEYQKAEIKSKYVEIPEGTYQVYVDSFGIKESKKVLGEIGLAISMKIIEGQYAGCYINKYIPVKPDSMDRLKADLTVLQFKYTGITSLDDEDCKREMLDAMLDVRVTKKYSDKTKKTYTNVWLNRHLGFYEHPNELQEEPATDYPPWGGSYQ